MYTTGGTISDPPAFGHKISMPSRPLSVHLRLTPELKARLQAEASGNDRSINSEILGRLERSFDLDAADRARVLQLLSEAAQILKGR